MKNLKLYKQYSNLPKFDTGGVGFNSPNPTLGGNNNQMSIGSTGILLSTNSNGRQLGYDYNTRTYNSNGTSNLGTSTTDADTSGFSSTPGEDLTNDINQQKNIATSSYIGMGTSLASAAINSTTSIIAANAASSSGTAAGATALSTVGNVAGAVFGAAGAVMGGMQAGLGMKAFGNVLGDGVLDRATNYGTEQIGSRTYKVNNGYDERLVNELQDKQTSAARALTMMGSVGAGIGAGAAIGAGTAIAMGAGIGSAVPGIGTAIGAAVGLIVGGILSIFGGKKAKREAERRKRNAMIQQNVMNQQNEANAKNDAAKDNYYGTTGTVNTGTADKGKNEGEMLTKYNNNDVKGLASPDEGMINMATGETKYLGNPNPNVKDPRKDVVPVGGEDFDENVAILGHLLNYADPYGRTFADMARPLFKYNEMLKNSKSTLDLMYRERVEENKNHKHRDKVTKDYMLKKYDLKYLYFSDQINQQYQDNALHIAELAQQQDMQKQYLKLIKYDNYYKGKTPLRKFKFGWGDVGNFLLNNGGTIVNSLASLWALKKESDIIKDKGSLTKLNVQNKQADKALRVLENLHYNPDPQLRALLQQDRLNLYNIRSASNLSAGQKAALANASANENAMNRYAVSIDAFNKNAKYKQDYANALMQAGEAQANRDYNAQQLYEQQRIAQNASYVTNQLNHYKNVMSQLGNITQNISGQKYNNKLLDLYAKDVELRSKNNQTNPTYTTQQTPSGQTPFEFNGSGLLYDENWLPQYGNYNLPWGGYKLPR